MTGLRLQSNFDPYSVRKFKIHLLKATLIDIDEIWNYACRLIQQSFQNDQFHHQRFRRNKSQSQAAFLINILRFDAFADSPLAKHYRKSLRRFVNLNSIKIGFHRPKNNRQYRRNLHKMCDSVKNFIKSRPHGDETTLYTNSEINYPEEASLTFDFDKNFTEPVHTHNSVTPPVHIIDEAFKCSELQNEMITTAYERAVDSEDISEITEDIDTSLFELRSLEGEINNAHTISPTSVSVLDKTQNLTGELVSQIFGPRSRRNISSRIEELSRSFSVSQGSEHFPPSALLRCLSFPKHQAATVKIVEEHRNFVFISRLVISDPSYATPLSEMILESVPIRSVTEGGYSNSAHATQERIPQNGPQSFAGNPLHLCSITQEDIAYYPINSANHKIVKKDETECYQLDSGSVSFDWNVVQEMNEPSVSLPPNRNCETIGSDMTISSISRVPISNCTRSSSYNEVNNRLTRTNQSSVNRITINNRVLILKWTLANVLILSAYGAFISYYSTLTLGDLYSVGGYFLGLCIVVLIIFVQTGRAS